MNEADKTQEPSGGEGGGHRSQPRKSYETPKLTKSYGTPTLTKYGDLRDLSKGQYAFSMVEGTYQEMNPPSN